MPILVITSQRTQRFVEQQDFRLDGERTGDPDPLRHAARKLARIGCFKALQPDEIDIALGNEVRLVAGEATRLKAEADVIDDGQTGQKARFLEYDETG
jgi:hypothetical protein